MNKIVKDALILFAITLVAGVLLGFVYDITKDPIAAQNEKAKQEAYKEVMADADSFEALSGDAYSEANITATFAAALQADAENYTADEITEVVAGVKDGKVIGLVVTVVAGDGYGGDIKFSVGVGADGTYLGTSILSISETAGLGMRVKTSPDFLAQFKSANTDIKGSFTWCQLRFNCLQRNLCSKSCNSRRCFS